MMMPQAQPPEMTFFEMLRKLYSEKHTGPVVVHFAQGQPNTVEIPKEPERIKLDKRRKSA